MLLFERALETNTRTDLLCNNRLSYHSLILEVRPPHELEFGERVLSTGCQDKFNSVWSVAVRTKVGINPVQGNVEIVYRPVTKTVDAEQMIFSQHDSKRRFGFAVLVEESQSCHDGKLVCRVVRVPFVDICHSGFVVHLIATEAEVKRRRGVESKRTSHAIHESSDT